MTANRGWEAEDEDWQNMAKVNKLGVFSFAKFQGIILGILGLIAGTAYSFGGLIFDTMVSMGWVSSNVTSGLSFGTVLAFGALLGMPVIFASFGFIAGIIEALLYNLFARWFGGFDLDFE